MSKRMKVIISALVVALLLTVGTTATVMAQEEPTPTPPVEAKKPLARVAEILGIPTEDLGNAFRQAHQEMRGEAFIKALDKAVERELISEEEAEEIKEWWEQKPEALNRLALRARTLQAMCSRQMITAHRGWQGPSPYTGPAN